MESKESVLTPSQISLLLKERDKYQDILDSLADKTGVSEDSLESEMKELEKIKFPSK